MHSKTSEVRRTAWSPRRIHGLRFAAVLAMLAGLFSACGGGDGPPDQTPAVRNQLTGIATSDGSNLQTFNISAKGAVGPSRTNSFSGNPSTTYSVSTERLTPPFMVQALASADVSVATANGRANITPLTSLLTIALMGQSPSDAFNDYGDASAAQIALINDAEIRRAQADATDFLENTLRVQVRSGDASFITTEFQPVAGDPMWDTLVELTARIAEIGPEGYNALLAGFVQRQQQCRRAQVQLTIGGATTRFCPATTASTPNASDARVLDHVYAQATGEQLTLRVRGDSVLDAMYVTAEGARYGCSGPACSGITLGRAAFDTTRSVGLSSVDLAGDGASATASGSLSTTVPNVTLADLPCLVGSLHRIAADGSVDSQCVDNSTSLDLLDVSGTLGRQQGASTHADYVTNGISIVLNGAELVSITASVTSADGASSLTAECQGADCRGVTLGAATLNTNLGIETATRSLHLDGTVLRTVAADGSLGLDAPVRLKASLRLTYFSNVQFSYATPSDPPICDGLPVVAQLVPDDTPQWVYQLCGDSSVPIYSTPLDEGGLEISYNGALTIRTDADGRVVLARVSAYHSGGALGETFGCDGLQGCRGVQVGAPAANGNRRVSMVGAVFRNVAFDGFASGPRTGRVDGAFDVVPAGV